MAEAFSAALALEGFWVLIIGVVLAGVVRGFAGFGTGMIYMPIASQVLPPVWALVTMICLDLLGPLPAVPRALRDGQPRDVVRLGLGCAIGTPIGLLLLVNMGSDVFRFSVSIVAMILLGFLISGYRYHRPVGARTLYVTGGISGVFGGAVGLAGPPAILLYMARPLAVSAIRANILLYLIVTDVLLLIFCGIQGLLEWVPVLVGILLIPAYMLSVWVGSSIFDPDRAVVYRWVAYAIIAFSALSGLPIWD